MSSGTLFPGEWEPRRVPWIGSGSEAVELIWKREDNQMPREEATRPDGGQTLEEEQQALLKDRVWEQGDGAEEEQNHSPRGQRRRGGGWGEA